MVEGGYLMQLMRTAPHRDAEGRREGDEEK